MEICSNLGECQENNYENKPLVSIIIPVYNTGTYLSECLDSAIAQTYKFLEIICVDDGSLDNSKEILNIYSKKDKRIKVFYRNHQGVSNARNFAIEQAIGDYITFLDSDDKYDKNVIKTSIDTVIKYNPDIVINFLNIGINLCNKKIDDVSFLFTPQLFISKKVLDKYLDVRYTPSLTQDEDALFSHKLLALSNKVYKNYNSQYFYRRHKKQNSKLNIKDSLVMLNNLKLELKDLISFYKKYNLFETHKVHCAKYIKDVIYTAYIVVNWSDEAKDELFNLIHYIIKKYKLDIDFSFSNFQTRLYKKFVKTTNYKKFEIYRCIVYLCIKRAGLYKILKNFLIRRLNEF